MSKVIKGLPIFFVLILMVIILFITGFTSKKSEVIQNVYQVYLDGEKIGIISSKKELEDYINKQQSILKNKFDVKNVYVPKGLDIKEYNTYNEKIDSIQSIYNKIHKEKPFTLKGYVIKIKSSDDTKTIYSLDKDIFTNALKKAMLTFVDKDQYQLYLDNDQVEIKETGSIIENVDLEAENYTREKIKLNNQAQDIISAQNNISENTKKAEPIENNNFNNFEDEELLVQSIKKSKSSMLIDTLLVMLILTSIGCAVYIYYKVFLG